MPFVYTNWKHFTVEDGLPNDHVFAVKADSNDVWVGTENGLALIDKKQGKVVKLGRNRMACPFQAVTAIEVDKNPGDVWLGLFGGGLARFSAGRFEHFNQLNSGLVNDVVYGIAVQGERLGRDHGRLQPLQHREGRMGDLHREERTDGRDLELRRRLRRQGQGVSGGLGQRLPGVQHEESTNKSGDPWKVYLDPDGEMEIDLYRDDGIMHVIVTGVSPAEDVLWLSSYFGYCRYDGRHWRGIYAQETGLPSDFTNNVKARSANECWFAHDKGWASLPISRPKPS